MPRRHPTLLWADRLDKLFVTALLPQLRDPAVALLPSGALQLNATSEDSQFAVELRLHGEVVPSESEWFAREQKLELTIAKAVRGRWSELLQADYPGEVRTDWQKYLDHDDELDELEQRSGIRGPAPEGNPGFAKAVDDYWRRKRVEKRNSNEFPDLDAVSKLAEKEHQRVGGDFNEIMQRLWTDARRDLEQQRERERREDAWATGEELEDEPQRQQQDGEQAPRLAPQASGEIRRKFAPVAETRVSSAVPVTDTTARRAAKKKKKRRAHHTRVADEL
jgi:hypothetical protein